MRSSVARKFRLVTLNIRSGQAGRLDSALRELKQGNVNVGMLQETKLTKVIHTHHSAGYSVWAT